MTDTKWIPTPDDLGMALRHLNEEQQATALAKMSNTMGFDPATRGLDLGKALCNKHRTIQGVLVNWLIGILVGLATQEYTDQRNKQAIETCKFIALATEDGQIKYQPFI